MVPQLNAIESLWQKIAGIKSGGCGVRDWALVESSKRKSRTFLCVALSDLKARTSGSNFIQSYRKLISLLCSFHIRIMVPKFLSSRLYLDVFCDYEVPASELPEYLIKSGDQC